MSACLSRALQKTQGSCVADLVRLSDEEQVELENFSTIQYG